MTSTTTETVGTVEYAGTLYEIRWPRRIDDPSQREVHAEILVGTELWLELHHPLWWKGKTLTNEGQIMFLAAKTITLMHTTTKESR